MCPRIESFRNVGVARENSLFVSVRSVELFRKSLVNAISLSEIETFILDRFPLQNVH